MPGIPFGATTDAQWAALTDFQIAWRTTLAGLGALASSNAAFKAACSLELDNFAAYMKRSGREIAEPFEP